MIRRALEAMVVHDANEERRYLREGPWSLTWSWLWLDWFFGLHVGVAPLAPPYTDQGHDAFSVVLGLGPLSLEVHRYSPPR